MENVKIYELFVTPCREGQKRGFDPSSRKHTIKIWLAHCVLELILRVG